jgi:exonuclease III
VQQTLASSSRHIACLQETKLRLVDDRLVQHLGGFRLNNFACLAALGPSGTRGGILLLWNDNYIDAQQICIRTYSVTAFITIKESGLSFLLTSVYGQTRANEKSNFLAEIHNIKPTSTVQWLLLGDFNLIYKARDKNNTNLNLRCMRNFRSTLNSCNLKEVHLQNRKFTWSNERRNPTMVRLDRIFCNDAWDLSFPSHVLKALSTSLSDHCPLLLSNQENPPRPRPFRFENFWTSMPSFLQVVQQAWVIPNTHTNPVQRLNFRLAQWQRRLESGAKLSSLKLSYNSTWLNQLFYNWT